MKLREVRRVNVMWVLGSQQSYISINILLEFEQKYSASNFSLFKSSTRV